MKPNNFLKLIGILWSSSKKYSRDILMQLSLEYNIDQISIYDLNEEYSNFIYDCYKHDEDVMSDGYIEEKVERLLKDESGQIVAFTIIVQNPEYNTKTNKQCIQARETKERIRKEFSSKVENYFLDNIIHLSDNIQETNLLKDVLNKYNKYAKKTYLRNGSQLEYAYPIFREEHNEKLKFNNQIDIEMEK